MKTISHLDRVGCGGLGSRSVVTSAVPTNDFDAGMAGQPGGGGIGFPVFEHVNGSAGLAVDQDAAVDVTSLRAKSSMSSTRGVSATGSGRDMSRRSILVRLTGAGAVPPAGRRIARLRDTLIAFTRRPRSGVRRP
jgi:hypothetical protein